MVRERTDQSRRFRWWPEENRRSGRWHVPRIHGPHHEEPSDDLGFLGRMALVAVAAFLFFTGFKISGAQSPSLGWVLVELLLYVGAIGFLFGAVLVGEGWSQRIQLAVALALGLALVFSVSYEILVLNPSYGTDVLAFAHGGAEMLLEGENPYEATSNDVERIAGRFGVGRTFTEAGEPIDWLISYPSLHVLAFTFFVGVEVADLRWALLFIEVVTLAVIWRLLSPRVRLMAPLIILLEPYLSTVFTGGGVTDWLWVLPVVGGAVSMHQRRFGWSGLLLGLACAIKQHPWFVVPFALIWVIKTVRRETDRSDPRRSAVLSFVGALAAGFVVPNLPFILWSPLSWFESVMSPAFGQLSTAGHGLAILTQRGLIDVSSLVYLSVFLGAAMALMIIYYVQFNRVQDVLWLMPIALLFLSHRALHSYFVFWLPVVIIWLDMRWNPRGKATSAS